MYSGCSGDGGRLEAVRLFEISVKLLHARDLMASKRFAELAIDSDPFLDAADEIIAVVDVLLASQHRINNHHYDWYSILQLKPPTSDSAPNFNFSAIRTAYRRLARLLHPHRNRLPGAEVAFQFISDAWIVLSDPGKKRLYDDEIGTRAASLGRQTSDSNNNESPPPTFWTLCPRCFRAYEYEKVYEDRNVKCEFCLEGFVAAELSAPPPIVEGTDMYYCHWGMFPLGFPGCPAFSGVAIPRRVSTRCTFPRSGKEKVVGDHLAGEDAGRVSGAGTKTTTRKHKKVMAKRPRRGMMAADVTPEDENVNGHVGFRFAEAAATGGSERGNVTVARNGGSMAGDFAGRFDMNSFSIDFGGANDVLGNFSNLPFAKDDNIVIIR